MQDVAHQSSLVIRLSRRVVGHDRVTALWRLLCALDSVTSDGDVVAMLTRVCVDWDELTLNGVGITSFVEMVASSSSSSSSSIDASTSTAPVEIASLASLASAASRLSSARRAAIWLLKIGARASKIDLSGAVKLWPSLSASSVVVDQREANECSAALHELLMTTSTNVVDVTLTGLTITAEKLRGGEVFFCFVYFLLKN